MPLVIERPGNFWGHDFRRKPRGGGHGGGHTSYSGGWGGHFTYHKPGGGSVPLTPSRGSSAPASAPARGASSRQANAAARQQHALIKKYVFHQEKEKLADKHISFDKQDKAEALKEGTRKVGEDIHAAAERIRNATPESVLGKRQAHRLSRINAKGKVISEKGLGQLVRFHQAAAKAGGYRTLKTGLTGPQRQAKAAIGEDEGVLGTIRHAATSRLPVPERFRATIWGTKGDVSPVDIAAAIAPVPAIKGAKLLQGLARAKVGAPEGRALLSEMVAKGATRAAPRLAPKIGKGLTRAGRVPVLGRAARFEAKPLTSTAKTAFIGAAVAHPGHSATDLAAAVGSLKDIDARDIAKGTETGAKVITHLPTAVEFTARALADPKARSETFYGLKELAFSAIEFPVLAPYMVFTEGLRSTVSQFATGYGKDIDRRWSPVLDTDYDKFLEQAQKPGGGGVAYTLTELLPMIHGVDVGAKGLVRATAEAGTLAHMPAAKALRSFLTDPRLPLQRSAGAPGPPAPISRGLVATVEQRVREKMGKARYARQIRNVDVDEKRFMPSPLRARARPPARDSKFWRQRAGSKIATQERQASVFDTHETAFPAMKIARRHALHDEVFAIAVEHGAPKTAEAMVNRLIARRGQLQKGAPEIAQIDMAIADLRKNPKIISEKFRRDVAKFQGLQREAEARAKIIPEDVSARAHEPVAEFLAKDPESKLPGLEKLGPTEWKVAKDFHAGVKKNIKQARSQVKIAESGVEQAKLTLATRRAKLAGTKGRRRATVEKGIEQAKRRVEAASARVKVKRTELRKREQELRQAGEKLKAEKGKRGSIERNWYEDLRTYTKAVGTKAIEAENRRLGMGTPGYFHAREAQAGGFGGQGKRLVSTGPKGVKKSHGALAREGRRDLRTQVAVDQMRRLADTEAHRRTAQREGAELGAGIADFREQARLANIELPHAGVAERKLTARQKQEIFVAAGHDKTAWIYMDPDTWGRRIAKDLEGVDSEKGYLELSEAALKDASATVSVMDEHPAFDAPGGRFIPKDESEILREAAGMTPGALKDGMWSRFKTFTSKALLANPGWLTFQLLAPVFLAGIGKPGVFNPKSWDDARKFFDGLSIEQKHNFEMVYGTSRSSMEAGYEARSVLHGIQAMKGITGHPTFRRAFEGRSLSRSFYGFVPKWERQIRRVSVYRDLRREAWRQMDGHMRKMGYLFDKIDNRLLSARTKAEHARKMDEIAADLPLMEQVARETIEWFGDYEVFNRLGPERIASQGLLFYGFLRHSMMLALWTLPVKHPLRLALFAKASNFVADKQKEWITQNQRDQFADFLMEHFPEAANQPHAREHAEALAKEAIARTTQIPIEMQGRFMFPDGQVIDAFRAGPLGNTLLQSDKISQLASMVPGANLAAMAFTGTDLFTGAQTQFGQEDPKPHGPGEVLTALAAGGLGYISPLRMLSQAMSKYPSSERTAGSFPPILPEKPQKYETFAPYMKQMIRRQEQLRVHGGWKAFEQAVLPLAPHPTGLNFAAMLYNIDPLRFEGGIAASASTKSAKRSARKSKKSASQSDSIFGKAGGSSTSGDLFSNKSKTKATTSLFKSEEKKDRPYKLDPGEVGSGGQGFFHQIRVNLLATQGTAAEKFFGGSTKNSGGDHIPAAYHYHDGRADAKIHARRPPPHLPGPKPDQKHHPSPFAKKLLAKFEGDGPDARAMAVAAVKYGKETGVNPSILMSIGNIESGFGTNVTGPANYTGEIAQGHMQFLPSTAQGIKDKYGVDALSGDPGEAVHAAALLLRDARFEDSPTDAIFSYNHSAEYVANVQGGAARYAKLDKLAGGAVKGAPTGGSKALLGKHPGKMKVVAGANRAGVPLTKEITQFVRNTAGRLGHPIVVTTGSNHDQLTVNGTVSDHWSGNATDIAVPIDSSKGDHIATSALIAAGIGKKEARSMATTGGIHNVNKDGYRIQIIWRAEGHHDHVHIGISGGTGTSGLVSSSGASGSTGVPTTGGVFSTGTATGSTSAPNATPTTRAGATPIEALSQLRKGGGAGLALGGLLEGVTPAGSGTPPTGGAPTIEQMQAIATEIAAARKKLLSR